MKFEIKSWMTGGVLFSCETETLKLAVELAVKQKADLSYASLNRASLNRASLDGASLDGASLVGASLDGASLDGASLVEASLNRASLVGASLVGASLNRASGVDPNRCTPLRMLLDQPGPIRAYKLVTAEGHGPFNGGLHFAVGKTVEVSEANTDDRQQCAAGVNLCTLDWAMREWREGYRILVVEFTAADIAAIPIGTDGKFRVRRCTVVAEKDLVALGLVKALEATGPAKEKR